MLGQHRESVNPALPQQPSSQKCVKAFHWGGCSTGPAIRANQCWASGLTMGAPSKKFYRMTVRSGQRKARRGLSWAGEGRLGGGRGPGEEQRHGGLNPIPPSWPERPTQASSVLRPLNRSKEAHCFWLQVFFQ